MVADNTGFEGDGFGGKRYYGLYMGEVVERGDGDLRGRVRVNIPGLLDGTSAWAVPRGGGSSQWGFVAVPPIGADVYVQFINGDINRPRYEPADYGIRDGKPEMFPEHDDPDVIVGGFGPFRVVIDLRSDEETGVAPSLVIKQVATLSNGSETDTAWVRLSENSVQAYGDSAAQVTSGALTDIDSEGDIQVKGRKIMPQTRPIK